MKMVTFLLIAVVIMAVCFGALGGWLLPRFGIEGMAANAICGGLGGALVALIYVRNFKRPDGA